MRRIIAFFERFDWFLGLSVLALVGFGCLLIYSISISQEQTSFLRLEKQVFAACLGIVCAGILTWLDYRHTRSFSTIGYLLGLALLASVLVFGARINGTSGWFQLGTFSFQPVELAKLTLVLYLAAFFARRARGRLTWKMFLQSGVTVGLYVFLVLAQPDFGSAMVMVGTWLILCLFIGLPRYAFFILPIVALLAAGTLWEVGLKPYQRARVLTFFETERDTQNTGYNAMQAKIAIGSGGLMGKGLGAGSQARLRFLPESSTDFIFSVLGEELGLVGILLTLSLYTLVIGRLLWIGYASQDDYAALVLVGGASVLTIHVTVNGGMNLGLLPITGIPMPFLSAGASSLISCFLLIGIAESIALRRNQHPSTTDVHAFPQ